MISRRGRIPCSVMGCTNPAIYIGYLDDDPDSIMFLCEEHKDSADEVELLESEVAEN